MRWFLTALLAVAFAGSLGWREAAKRPPDQWPRATMARGGLCFRDGPEQSAWADVRARRKSVCR